MGEAGRRSQFQTRVAAGVREQEPPSESRNAGTLRQSCILVQTHEQPLELTAACCSLSPARLAGLDG